MGRNVIIILTLKLEFIQVYLEVTLTPGGYRREVGNVVIRVEWCKCMENYHGNFIHITVCTFWYFLPPNDLCCVNDVSYAAGSASSTLKLNKDRFELNEKCV